MVGRKYPEQAFRSCLGVLRLGKSFGEERLENACRRALYMEPCSFKSIESILKNNLDLQPLPEPEPEVNLPNEHDNLRGSDYYN